MKKIVVLLFTVFTIFTLSACGTSVHEDLQENEWNVVATNGEAYTADFHADTVTFQLRRYVYNWLHLFSKRR